MRLRTSQIVRLAWRNRMVVPGFNIPYLPMMAPTVQALRDTRCFGLIMVARLEWVKFKSGSLRAVRDAYERCGDERYTRLHLDHVPVVDEDQLQVDYAAEIAQAIELGYESVMVDGSRLGLEENIRCTRQVVEIAARAKADVAVEAELGAVLGHEAGPLPPYEELFASGRGFTRAEEACRFVQETRVDWLSVAIGNIHGAIADATRGQKKPEARLSQDYLQQIQSVTAVPLVLHGGTGIRQADVLEAIGNGIAKMNIATATRQPYERLMGSSIEKAQQAVYDTMVDLVRNELKIAGSADVLNGAAE